jgi:hypothetical protein
MLTSLFRRRFVGGKARYNAFLMRVGMRMHAYAHAHARIVYLSTCL